MPERHKSDILFAFAIAVALALAYELKDVLLVIYVSALFAVVTTPFVERVQKLHIGKLHTSKGLAIMLMLAAVAIFATLFCWLVFPPIIRDIQQLASDLPGKLDRAQDRIHNVPWLYRISQEFWQKHVGDVAGVAVKVVPNVARLFIAFFSFLVMTAYFILDGERAERWFISMMSPATGKRLHSTLMRARDRLRRWLIGQLTLMLLLGILVFIIFGLLHIRYFTVLAVFTGLANIIPIIGPIVSFSLGMIVAAFDSWTKVLGVVIFYAIYQQLENAVLTPRIMKATVGLPSLAIIVALAIGGALGGILGALVAVPSAAIISELADEYLVKPKSEKAI
jgi:predicted PurR-regulated permease PerM